MQDEDSDPSRIQKIKQHLKDNKKAYFIGVGGVVLGASVATGLTLFRVGRVPLEVNQSASNTALIVWKPKTTQIALVKKACMDPIPVLDKLTGEAYASINRAAKATGETVRSVSLDAQGASTRFERLPETVFA